MILKIIFKYIKCAKDIFYKFKRWSLSPCFFKILFVLLVFCFSSYNIAYSCSYKSEIEQCIKANKSGNIRTIDEFICIVGTPEQIAYQVILDKKFNEIDDKMDKYLFDLEETKNLYFGINRQKTYIDGINDIADASSYFKKQYSDLCGPPIISDVASCMEDEKTSIKNSKNYFKQTSCMALIELKMEIFDEIAFGVLMLNKQQIKTDEKKKYDKAQRKDYNKLIDLMMINLGYIERIWAKVPSFTKNILK